jgi:hypothetical protein
MDGDGSDGITQRRSLLAYRPSLAKQHIVASWQQEHDEASCIPVWSSTDYIYVGGAKKIRAARLVGRERMPLRRTTRLFADTRTRAIAVPSGNNLPDGARFSLDLAFQPPQVRAQATCKQSCPACRRHWSEGHLRAGSRRVPPGRQQRASTSPGRNRESSGPHGVRKMLAGLMSRWTMPFECAASSASARASEMSTAAGRSNAPRASRCCSVSPSSSSIARYGGSAPTSNTVQMCG